MGGYICRTPCTVPMKKDVTDTRRNLMRLRSSAVILLVLFSCCMFTSQRELAYPLLNCFWPVLPAPVLPLLPAACTFHHA